jgi:hypothetical protein
MPNQWILAITLILSTLLLSGWYLNISGHSANVFTGVVSAIVFSTTMFGLFRLLVGLVTAIKNPTPPRIQGSWDNNPNASNGYGNWDGGLSDTGSHGSSDFGMSDGNSACDVGGPDGGGCHGE